MIICKKDDTNKIFSQLADCSVEIDGKIVTDTMEMNEKYSKFDKWIIKQNGGLPVNKKKIKREIEKIKIKDIESNWATKYESKWDTVVNDLEAAILTDKSNSITAKHKDYLMKFYVALDWRSFQSNDAFQKVFQDFSGGNKGGFYFANQGTVSKGESTFKQIWGNRSLSDNWRTSARSTSLEDLKNEAMGVTSAPDPRRLETSFYIEKIPTNTDEILALKKARDTASLGLGRMYDAYFSDTKLATKTLYDLVDNKPVEEVELPALYQIFVMNYEKNPEAAERAKQKILSDFPYTSYAEFVKNPKNTSFSKSSEEVEKAYSEAFDLYSKEKYEESKALIEASLEKYPKDALVPKFALLNAFNSGKTAGKEIMILQLEQIALNYAKTLEGEKAREMLKYLKSDLTIEKTDEQGNVINENPQVVQQTQGPTDGPQSPPQGSDRPSVPGSPVPVSTGFGTPQNVKKVQEEPKIK